MATKTNAQVGKAIKAAIRDAGIPTKGITVRSLRSGVDGYRYHFAVTMTTPGIRRQDVERAIRDRTSAILSSRQELILAVDLCYEMYFRVADDIERWLGSIDDYDSWHELPEGIYQGGDRIDAMREEVSDGPYDIADYSVWPYDIADYFVFRYGGEEIKRSRYVEVIASEMAKMIFERSAPDQG